MNLIIKLTKILLYFECNSLISRCNIKKWSDKKIKTKLMWKLDIL